MKIANLKRSVLARGAFCQTDLEYIDWAEDMLVEGYDSSGVRILAGLDREESTYEAALEVERYFRQSIKALKVKGLDPGRVVRAYACEIAQRIIYGVTTNDAEVHTLSQLFIDLGEPDEYAIWYKLYDAYLDITADREPYAYLM